MATTSIIHLQIYIITGNNSIISKIKLLIVYINFLKKPLMYIQNFDF